MPDIQEGETVETVSDDFEYATPEARGKDIAWLAEILNLDPQGQTMNEMSSPKLRRLYLSKSSGYNMGGIVDELGYLHGGVPHGERDPIKYAAGGAVRGKRFVGTF